MENQIIIFPSVHFALMGEEALKKHAIPHLVIPVPPYINEGCGLGIKLETSITGKVLEIFKECQVETEKVVDFN